MRQFETSLLFLDSLFLNLNARHFKNIKVNYNIETMTFQLQPFNFKYSKSKKKIRKERKKKIKKRRNSYVKKKKIIRRKSWVYLQKEDTSNFRTDWMRWIAWTVLLMVFLLMRKYILFYFQIRKIWYFLITPVTFSWQ